MSEIITFGAAFDPSGVVRGVSVANQKLNELAAAGKKNEATFAAASASTTRFSERGAAALRALSTESRKTSSAFQQLAADVRLAQADFAAGRIGSGDLATALNVAQQSASAMRTRGIIPAGADLGAFNQVMRATVPHAQGAGVGLGQMRMAVTALAASVMGVNPQLARLSGSMLAFGTGTLASIGVFAGLAAVGLLIQKIGERARETREAIREFLKAQEQIAIGRLPETARLGLTAEEMGERVIQARGFVTREEARVRQGLQFGAARGMALGARGPVMPGEAEVAFQEDKKVVEARQTLARLLGAQARLQQQITEAAEDELDATLKSVGFEQRVADAIRRQAEAREALTTMQPVVRGPTALPGTRAHRIAAAFVATETRAAQAEQGGLASILQPLSKAAADRVTDVLEAERRLAKERLQAIKDAAAQTKDAAAQARQLWGAVISGASSLVQSLIRGDATAGSVIGGVGATIGGAVAGANPLAGLAIMGGSGILGALFGAGGQKEVPVRDDGSRKELERLRREIEALEQRRPKQITIQLLDSRGTPMATRAAMANISREGALGAIPLLP